MNDDDELSLIKLLEEGADPNHSSYDKSDKPFPLIAACQYKKYGMVKLIIKKTTILTRPTEKYTKRTVFHFASMNGELEILKLLKEKSQEKLDGFCKFYL